jgi:Ca2+-binding RTX toxin-like protein
VLAALGKAYELAFMKALAQASSTVAGEISDQSQNIAVCRDLAVLKVSRAIAESLAQAASVECDPRVAEILNNVVCELQDLSTAAGARLVELAAQSASVASVEDAVGVLLGVDAVHTQGLLDATPGAEWSVYQIIGAAREIVDGPNASDTAYDSASLSSALFRSLGLEEIQVATSSVVTLAESLQTYAATGGEGWQSIAADAGGAALLLHQVFVQGDPTGLQLNSGVEFFTDAGLTSMVSQLIGSGTVDEATVHSYLTETELAAWLVGAIDSGVSLDEFNRLVDSAAAAGSGLTEVFSLIDRLRLVFADDSAPAESLSAMDLYQSVFTSAEQLLAAYPDGLQLELLFDRSAESIEGSAAGWDEASLAYRYALAHLNTFAVVGADYTRFSEQGELQFDSEYLASRPRMLATLAQANVADLAPSSEGALQTPDTGGTYVDRDMGVTITGADPGPGVTIYDGSTNAPLVGTAAVDQLFGEEGDDSLDGLTGADVMAGGTGNDSYVVDDAGDVVVEHAGEGKDTVLSSVSFALGDGMESLHLTGSVAISGTGNALDNVLVGNAAANTLIAGAGDDVADGGDGNDVLDGGDGDDALTGGDGDDLLIGAAGNDILVAGTGRDTLLGGAGNDVVIGKGGDLLDGGTGKDVYQVADGDVVQDSDGSGTVHFGALGQLTGGERRTSQPFYVSQDGKAVYREGEDGSLQVWGEGQRITIRPGAGEVGPRNRSADGSSPLDGGTPDAPAGGKPMLGVPMRGGGATSDPSYKTPFLVAMGTAAPRRDPLLLDLDGDGIETLGVGAVTFFDHDANGFAELTGWVGTDDGMLVMDRDGDGHITSGRELFGDQSVLQSGAVATSGMQALAEWDLTANGGNGDGNIDASDAAWSRLRVWRDADGDGFTDEGELIALSDAGIDALSLAFSDSGVSDGLGNSQARLSNFVRADGSLGAMGDYLLARNTTISIAESAVAVSADIAALPEVRASGNVLDLRQAMARDSGLRDLVQSFLGEADIAARGVLLDKMLYRWAGAEGIDPGSRGNTMDARKLVVLEKFVGMEFVGALGADPVPDAAVQLLRGYHDLREQVNAKLMAQGPLAELYDSIGFSWDESSQSVRADLTRAVEQIDAELQTDPAGGRALLSEFARMMRGLGELSSVDYQRLRAHYAGMSEDLAIAFDTGGLNVVSVAAGSGRVLGTDNAESLLGSDEGETVTAFDGDDIVFGLGGDDLISGCEGNDQLSGGMGTDILFGAVGDDLLDGGVGNDYLNGGFGDDTYMLSRGAGQDTVVDYDATLGNRDVIRVAPDIANSEVLYWRSGNDLLVGIAGTSDVLRVQEWYLGPANRVEAIQLADGSVIGADALAAARMRGSETAEVIQGSDSADYIEALAGTDVLKGGWGDDVLDGGAGDDTLYGGWDGYFSFAGAGNDTYLFGRGYGNETIYDYDTTVGSIDTLRLIGLTLADVTIKRDASSFYVTINDTGETLRVADWGAGAAHRVERIEFADGLVLQGNQLNALMMGTDGNDNMTGSSEADVMQGLSGNDVLQAGAGDDTLDGGAGDDVLYGGISGYTVAAGAGSDTYLFGVGSGNDEIYDYDATEGNVDTVRLTGLNAGDVTIGRDATTLSITINATGETLRVRDWGAGWEFRIERVVFADGSVLEGEALANTPFLGSAGNDNMTGTSGNDAFSGLGGNDVLLGGAGDDILDGGAGDDALYGGYSGYFAGAGAGNDTYVFGKGYGNDVIYDFDATSGNIDTIRLKDLNAADVTLRRDAATFYLTINATGETLRVADWGGGSAFRIERVLFADGSVLAGAALAAAPYLGTDAAETLTGTVESELMRGLGGNDQINGGGGNDALSGDAGADFLRGEDGNDSLLGGESNDTLYGGNGNDLIDGGTGNDLMYGNLGDDVFAVDSASDRVAEGTGQGVDMVMATLSHTLATNVENLILVGSADLTGTGNVLNNALRGNSGNNILSGAGGEDWLAGGDGNDSLDGGTGVDVLQGGNGNDALSEAYDAVVLDGGAGSDSMKAVAASFVAGGQGDDVVSVSGTAAVVAMNAGDGHDTLYAGAQRTTLSVGAGVSYQDLALHRSGSDLVVELGADTSVRLQGWYDGGVAKPQFLTLQVMAEAMAGFDAASTDPLLNKRVQQFDLKQLASFYDEAAAADPTVDRWAAMNKLLDAHLASSDDAALGGDLARYYGNLGALSGMSLTAAQDTARSASFGQTGQALAGLDSLKNAAPALA